MIKSLFWYFPLYIPTQCYLSKSLDLLKVTLIFRVREKKKDNFLWEKQIIPLFLCSPKHNTIMVSVISCLYMSRYTILNIFNYAFLGLDFLILGQQPFPRLIFFLHYYTLNLILRQKSANSSVVLLVCTISPSEKFPDEIPVKSVKKKEDYRTNRSISFISAWTSGHLFTIISVDACWESLFWWRIKTMYWYHLLLFFIWRPWVFFCFSVVWDNIYTQN